MPTKLPERRVASCDRPVPLHVQISAAAILLLAVFATVSILARSGLSYAPDGDELVRSSIGSEWSLPIGFAP